ncbi:uncharacterized protein TNCV_2080171 [Trichonephila clavipes]|nr:uncharacterized protein TNCV_2080171 [Trichonephila clavipes]
MFLAGHPSQGCFGLQSHCAPCYFFNQASFYPSDFSFSANNRDQVYSPTLPLLIEIEHTGSKSTNPWCVMKYSANFYTPHFWGIMATPTEDLSGLPSLTPRGQTSYEVGRVRSFSHIKCLGVEDGGDSGLITDKIGCKSGVTWSFQTYPRFARSIMMVISLSRGTMKNVRGVTSQASKR